MQLASDRDDLGPGFRAWLKPFAASLDEPSHDGEQ